MTDRKYSVAEIDRMRAAVGEKVADALGGLIGETTKTLGEASQYINAITEERLRTYMLAGIGPEELEGEERK